MYLHHHRDGTTIEATRRTNCLYDGDERTYFIFVMPAADVMVRMP